MKKIMPLAASIAIIMIASLFAGMGTLAQFSDTETSENNVANAGTLDLEVAGSSSILHISIGNLKPGDGMGGAEHGTISYQFTVTNLGTLDGKLTMKVINVRNYENGRNEPELAVDSTGGNPGLGNGELGAYLNMQVNFPGDPGFVYRSCSDPNCIGNRRAHTINCWENVVIDSSMAGLPNYLIKAGQSYLGVLEFMLPSDVGNIIQSDSVEFDIEFTLEQA